MTIPACFNPMEPRTTHRMHAALIWVLVLSGLGFAAVSGWGQATPSTATPSTGSEPMTDTLMTWGVILLASAVVLLGVELLVPSGGLVSLAAALCVVGGIVCLFFHDTRIGALATVAVLFATPFVLGFMLKVWPHTPVGRWLTLDDEASEDVDDDRVATRETTAPQTSHVHVGDTGTTKTPLRPVGTCVIGGHRLECIAETGMIDQDAEVRVVDVEGTVVKVRAV